MAVAASNIQDWLALSNDPADADLYFIGPAERRITFFSQQVRALRLVHALHTTGQLPPNGRTAVVGAGAAGVTAAVALALLDQRVDLYDPAAEILQLQSASPRLLHPHIYEWPALGSLEDRAYLPFLDWTSATGANVCAELRNAFASATARLPNLKFRPGHVLKGISRVDGQWRLILGANGADAPQDFDKVFLSMGFGDEQLKGAAKANDYWKHNSTGATASETSVGTRYIVSGNGDGGLTDLLNLTIKDFEHLGFTAAFLQLFGASSRLHEVIEAATAGSLLDIDLEPRLEEHLLPLLKSRGILDYLLPKLRSDRHITINSNGPLFAYGKAAQLNQVMAFSVLQASLGTAHPIHRSAGYVDDVVPSGNGFTVEGISGSGMAPMEPYAHVFLRHGPNKSVRYEPAKAFYERYQKHARAIIAEHPELDEPPTLPAKIFDFFERLKIEKLAEPPTRADLNSAVTTRNATIVIERDRATQVVAQRGHYDLAELADQCERLPHPITIYLAVEADSFRGEDLVRLSRASNGCIRLVARTEVSASWKRLLPTVATGANILSPVPPVLLNSTNLSAAVDSCLLRLLDQRVTAAIRDGSCEILGPISESICGAIEPTWNKWQITLKADPEIRSDFLRLLVHVEQDGRPKWNGDHGSLPLLAGALILMLATHEGQLLKPALCSPGNLNFGDLAVALGTGCQYMKQELIEDWDDPDHWGVDALILSGTSEAEVFSSPGTVLTGGKHPGSLMAAKRVPPVIIQKNKRWRTLLGHDLASWKAAVEKEFNDWKERQDQQMEVST